MAKAPAPLSERERRFIEAYLADPSDQLRAYHAAGYTGPRSTACRFLKRPAIQAALAEARAARARKAQINADFVLHEAVHLYELAIAVARQEKTSGTLQAARAALEMVGKHIGVQAFQERSITLENEPSRIIIEGGLPDP